jgi:hypothetical protein
MTHVSADANQVGRDYMRFEHLPPPERHERAFCSKLPPEKFSELLNFG